MEKPLQLCYQVLTLDGEELLPAGTFLTDSTMGELVRSAEARNFPAVRFMEYGTIAADLQRISQHPPYGQMFSNPARRKDVFVSMQRVELPQPLMEIYAHFKIHDPYTYWHLLTVFALSLLLAQDLIEDRKELAREVAASPSHDFGKICVPLSILKKPTLLNERDQQLLSHHAAAGHVILSYYLRDPNHPAAITARDHHERCDGSGYPRGIKLQNRVVEIVAGGDVFDALISQRPYRPVSYDLRTALEEMTLQVERGAIRADVLHALIRCIRKDLSPQLGSFYSNEMRGTPPPGNLYRGILPCRYEPSCSRDEREHSAGFCKPVVIDKDE